MANGQQEEQQLPQVGTQQQPSLYQTLGSMKPDELLKFKGFMHRYKGQQQITRNVGGDRAVELMSEVESGALTVKSAVERSKAELTPSMKLIDQEFFKKDVTPSSMLILKERTGGNWTRTERNLWFSHYNSIQSRENKRLVGEGKLSKQVADNNKYALKAQVDYHNIEDAIFRGTKDLFETNKYGNFVTNADGSLKVGSFVREKDGKKITVPSMDQADLDMLTEKWSYIRSEVAKDLNPATYGQADQLGMQRALSVISNIVPEEYLRDKKGIIVGDEFISLYEQELETPALRKIFFDSLNSRLTRAKDHLTNVAPVGLETEESDPWSKYMVE